MISLLNVVSCYKSRLICSMIISWLVILVLQACRDQLPNGQCDHDTDHGCDQLSGGEHRSHHCLLRLRDISSKGGKHYEGTSVDGFGNELWIIQNGEKREKSISRSSVDYALKVVLESEEQITGPKQLGVFGSSYTFALFRRFGLV